MDRLLHTPSACFDMFRNGANCGALAGFINLSFYFFPRPPETVTYWTVFIVCFVKCRDFKFTGFIGLSVLIEIDNITFLVNTRLVVTSWIKLHKGVRQQDALKRNDAYFCPFFSTFRTAEIIFSSPCLAVALQQQFDITSRRCTPNRLLKGRWLSRS